MACIFCAVYISSIADRIIAKPYWRRNLKLKTIIAATLISVAPIVGATETQEKEQRPTATFSKKVVNTNPLEQIDAATKLVVLFCEHVTTWNGKNSLFANHATCRTEVMFKYLAQLVAETAPYAEFKKVE